MAGPSSRGRGGDVWPDDASPRPDCRWLRGAETFVLKAGTCFLHKTSTHGESCTYPGKDKENVDDTATKTDVFCENDHVMFSLRIISSCSCVLKVLSSNGSAHNDVITSNATHSWHVHRLDYKRPTSKAFYMVAHSCNDAKACVEEDEAFLAADIHSWSYWR